MSATSSHAYDPALVRPLSVADNQFLQVLVDRFQVRRKGNGFEFQVAFSETSPSICHRAAKEHILKTLPLERRQAMKEKLDAFFRSEEEVFKYDDPSFPFRLGNGGTLPVVRLDGADYYCLFYRDIHPIGWNIANGGANSRHDLLHPDLIVERELREELIITEPARGRWYVFDWHDARLRDHPDFGRAHDLWTERFRRQGFREFKDVPLPLKWSLPPDEEYSHIDQRHHDTIRIRFGNEDPVHTGQGFLNLNAEDFGIEFDRIAKLSVGPEAVFCDGELQGRSLLNQVVGLFGVKRVQRQLAEGERCFRPDRFFWSGEDRTGDHLEETIGEFLRERGSSWEEVKAAAARHAAGDCEATRAGQRSPGDLMGLCPASRTLIERHARLLAAEQRDARVISGGPFDIFISFASEDRALAKQVFERLETVAPRRVFFSDVTLTNGGFAAQIDSALDSSSAFVAVGSRVEHLYKSWVEYEWRNFHNDLASGRKPPTAPFLAFAAGFDPYDLPRPLRLQQAVRAEQGSPEAGLAELARRFSVGSGR